MLSVQESIARLLSGSSARVAQEDIHLIDALGRTLSREVLAVIDVPPADNSAMDGYAIRLDEFSQPDSSRPISQRIAAGHPPLALQEGTAARIFTGAEVPVGADTVVMQENCEADDTYVKVLKLPEKSSNIRPRAQDIRSGQRLFPAGHTLRAQDVGLLASQGLASVSVFKRLRVAIMSTGDELIEPGEQAGPGKIYNSNRYTLHGLLTGWGFEVLDLGVAPDDFDAISDRMKEAAQHADVIVSSGGVSVGDEDHVKAVVESLGSIDLWKIAIKPGKPFAFGQVMGTPFLGLPGNPVSVFVTLLIIGRPFLFSSQGMASTEVQVSRQPALFDKPGNQREDYLRVRSTAEGLELFSSQSSGVLMSTSWGDGLVRQRVGSDISRGDLVDYLPYSSLC
jgi:molybdopterin molybdotransferase